MKLYYTIKPTDNYITLKDILKNRYNMSNRLLLKLKRNEKIFLNGECTYLNTSIKPNDIIEIALDFEEDNSNIVATKMPLDIIYEDEAYLVINKPAGIPVHPSMEHYEDSLSNGVKYYFDSMNLYKKIRPVNRLDRNTSGIVIFAKNEYIQECLIRQMKTKDFIKEYIAICEGIFEEKSGYINLPIARKENSIIERCVDFDKGSNAITHYEVINEFDTYSVVKCRLETGRTHQIRVHMKYIGHPLLGDTLYHTASPLISRQALHSYYTCFVHPITRQTMEYIAPLPVDMKNIIN